MRKLRAAIVLIALGGMAHASDPKWESNGIAEGNAQLHPNCGAILGDSGNLWGAWQLASSSPTKLVSHTDLGGKWNGSQYLHSTAPTLTTDNTHYHKWVKRGGGTPDAKTLQVEVTSSPGASGSCNIMLPSDPQWWWMPNVVVLQTTPKVERYDTDTNAWVDWTGTEQDPTDGNGWDNTFYPGAPGVTQHTGSYASMHGGPTPSAPAHSGTSGHFGGKVQLPQSGDGTEFRVKFPFTVHAGADSDNAIVTNWKEYLHADCKSEINSSSPSSNSGWGNW